MTNLVFGIGVNSKEYPANIKGNPTKEYDLWTSLLRRCYSSKYQQGKPTYIGCSVSENFKNYSYFYKWVQNQIGFGQGDFQLDKDLLLRGNRVYSENTCLFLPRELNTLFTARRNHRGGFPLGVSKNGCRFTAECCTERSSRHIGRFDTPELAFQAYKQTKEAFIKQQAEKWKDRIDTRAYEALLRYEVLITD